jgi:hypothetical protein
MGACGAWPRGTLPVSASLPPAAITWATSCSAFGSAEAAARWPFELAGVDGGLDPPLPWPGGGDGPRRP